MSLTQWLTRSWPMVSWRSSATASLSFVPTPSMLDTSTGSRMPLKFGAEQPAEAARLAEHFRPVRGGERAAEAALEPVAEVDIDARAGVGFLCGGHLALIWPRARFQSP